MKVSIQGLQGSYHDIAARNFFGKKYQPVHRLTFNEVFVDVSNGHTDFALIAIENSLYGSVNQVYDSLLEHENLWICGEIYLRVRHCLIGLKGAKMEQLKEVHSHPIALSQCEVFLDEELPFVERFANHDTAGSVANIKQWKDPSKAAVASREAADRFGLSVLREEIETHHQNYTRFIVLAQEKVVPIDASKTSFVITQLNSDPSGDQKAGSLFQILKCFADRGISLSKIESRPIIGKAWHYIFYLDFDVSLADKKAGEALSCLEEQGAEMRVLGSYKAGQHIE